MLLWAILRKLWVEIARPPFFIIVFHFYLNFAAPAPVSVMLSSDVPNSIPPFGSSVTLTCAVELSPAVDVPVTVNRVLTTDEGFTTTRTA